MQQATKEHSDVGSDRFIHHQDCQQQSAMQSLTHISTAYKKLIDGLQN